MTNAILLTHILYTAVWKIETFNHKVHTNIFPMQIYNSMFLLEFRRPHEQKKWLIVAEE